MNLPLKPGPQGVAVLPPPTVTPGDPFGLAGAVLAAARAVATDPTLGAIVIQSGTDELTNPTICEDGAGGNLTGACSLGPSGARGHAVVVHTDAANHVVGLYTVNPSPGYYGSGIDLTVNGPNAVGALSQHQAISGARLSNVGLVIIPNVVTVSGGGGGGGDGVTMEQVQAAIAAALANFQGGGGVTGQDKIDIVNGVLDGLNAVLSGGTYRGADDPNLAHKIRAAVGGLDESAVTSAEAAAGTLTTHNFGQEFYHDPGVYERIAETAYESDVNAEKNEPKP